MFVVYVRVCVLCDCEGDDGYHDSDSDDNGDNDNGNDDGDDGGDDGGDDDDVSDNDDDSDDGNDNDNDNRYLYLYLYRSQKAHMIERKSTRVLHTIIGKKLGVWRASLSLLSPTFTPLFPSFFPSSFFPSSLFPSTVAGTLGVDSIEALSGFEGLLDVIASSPTAAAVDIVAAAAAAAVDVVVAALDVVVVVGVSGVVGVGFVIDVTVFGVGVSVVVVDATAAPTSLAPSPSSPASPVAVFSSLLPCVRSSVRTFTGSAAKAPSFLPLSLSPLSSVLPIIIH